MNLVNKNLGVVQLLFGFVCTSQTFSNEDIYHEDVWRVFGALAYAACTAVFLVGTMWPELKTHRGHLYFSLLNSLWFVYVLLLVDVSFITKFRHIIITQAYVNTIGGLYVILV